MIVRSITEIHQLVRDRMPDLTEEDVVAVAAFIWGEADVCGYRSGDNWSAFVAGMPTDMRDYYEVIQGGP